GYPVFCGEAYTNGFLQTGPRMYGFNNLLTMLAVEQDRVESFLDKLLEEKLKYYDTLFGLFGDSIDIINEGDDLGTQNGLFISPGMYRELIMPYQSKLYHYLKDKYKVKVFLHSCGAVSDLIPDLIEAGVDILNPIQISAKGMDVTRLKKDFGKDIVFWGGTIDSQKMLPYSTPQEIKDEVKRRIDQLAPGGGFVFAPIHNFQPDVPVENILAMWEAFQDNCKY
ncbi:MAG: uroporphyrinogen decarboxylase family protein, partial [Oscillospiraceae bacterium]